MKDELGWRSFDRWDFDECRKTSRAVFRSRCCQFMEYQTVNKLALCKTGQIYTVPLSTEVFSIIPGGNRPAIDLRISCRQISQEPLETLQLVDMIMNSDLKRKSGRRVEPFPRISDLSLRDRRGTPWKFYCYSQSLPAFLLHLHTDPKGLNRREDC